MENQLAGVNREMNSNLKNNKAQESASEGATKMDKGGYYNRHRKNRRARIITIASGKGGVGKTTFATNLAVTLASFKQDLKILFLDADWGMANAHLYLNERPFYTVEKVLAGEQRIEKIVHPTAYGFDLISGGNGINRLLTLSSREQDLLEIELARLEEARQYDFVIIDCGAGGSALVQRLLSHADEAILVTLAETAALTDAYSLIKAVWRKNHPPGNTNVSLVINQTENLEIGLIAGDKLIETSKRYLDLTIRILGILIDDPPLRRSFATQQEFYIVREPHGAIAAAMRKLSLKLLEQKGGLDPTKHESYTRAEGKGMRGFFKKIFSPRG